MTNQTPGNHKAIAAGVVGSSALIIVWFWDIFVPAHPMPAEIGIAISTLLSTLAVYVIPHGGNPST
jgi:hypothetical protein